MSIHNLDKIFKPGRVAVIGATDNPTSVGYTVLHNLVNGGFKGVVFPVNPRREAVQGIQAYPDVASLPHPADLAVICTPAKTVPGLVRACGEAGILGLVILSAGFREAGEAGRALEEELRGEIARFPGMRVIGPNCLGVIVPGLSLNASFAAASPGKGAVAFISQSGALCTSVLDWAIQERIGFSFFVSIGNMLDVDFGDLIDYFGADSATQSLILYIESVSEARPFLSAARAFARTKPIVAYKSGRFAESAKAAASHTGAMAGEDAVYDAAFARAGMVRVTEIDAIFDCAELLARRRLPKGPRLAIVTNAGGPGVMATDALIARRGELAPLAPATLEGLNAALPPFWSHGNPVDVLGDAPPERFAVATAAALTDPGVHAVLVVLTPQAMTDAAGTARAVIEVAGKSGKPVLAAWMGGGAVAEGVRLFNAAGIPTYTTPEQAVAAFSHLVSYARNLETIYETPRDIPVSFALDRKRLRDLFNTILAEGREILSEGMSKALLEAYEIPVSKPLAATDAEEAAEQAQLMGFPVALKVLSPDITHKSDVGGVALDLKSAEEVKAAYERIVAGAREKRPEARIDGVTVQPMLRTDQGVEIILGAKKDPTFGAVILVGMGGVTAELFQDRALGLPPLNESLALRMLQSLRTWPLLTGYRGRPAVNVDRLIEIIMRFSYLIADYPEIKELDVNPLLVTADGATALDARVVIDRKLIHRPHKPFAHLAIRPYPEEYTRRVQLPDEPAVTLRAIKPEDEPAWREMLAASSEESIRFRFRYLFKHASHEMAARYCFIDYDRELAIVAELPDHRLAGIGRLVADPDHTTAELGVFVADPWQGKGLGKVLVDYCLEIAKRWGVKEVTAEMAPDNARMIAMLERRGFSVHREIDEDAVVARKGW